MLGGTSMTTTTHALLRKAGLTLACALAMTALGGVAAAAPDDHVPLSVSPADCDSTPEQIMDVTYAATRFSTQAIRNEPLYPDHTAGLLAQSVQRSCCPERYDQSEGKALEMLAEVRAEEVR